MWDGSTQHCFIFRRYFALREKFPYLEFFSSVFSHNWTEYGEIRRIRPMYSEWGKIRSIKTPNMITFHAVLSFAFFSIHLKGNQVKLQKDLFEDLHSQHTYKKLGKIYPYPKIDLNI